MSARGSSNIGNPRTPNIAPISYHRCAAHGCLVAYDGDGTRLGFCAGCAAEAARGIRIIAQRIAVTQ